jgi:hypothetical protein
VHLTDDKCVDDGEAEDIGELIDSTFFVINFCPYFGKKLLSD